MIDYQKITCISLSLLFLSGAIQSEPILKNPAGEQVRLEEHIGNGNRNRNPNNASQAIESLPALEATWEGSNQWMTGTPFNRGITFNRSITFGVKFFGSNLSDSDYVPVRIVFSTDSVTLCQTFRRDLGYPAAGVGTFPGYVLDMSDELNPRRLNICFVEDNNYGLADLAWQPDESSIGKREYLQIMNSSYDGDGLTYSTNNLYNDAWSLDILYSWWPRVITGEIFLGTLPAAINLQPHYLKAFRAIPDDGQLTFTWHYTQTDAGKFCLYSGTTDPPNFEEICLSETVSEYTLTSLTNGVEAYYRIYVYDALDNLIVKGPTIAATPGIVASNMNLLGYWHQIDRYGDIWGYTEPGTGKEYALICARDEGVAIIDVSTMPPVQVSFIPSIVPGNDAKDVKIYGEFAIIIKEYESIQIMDISDIYNPVEVSQIPLFSNSGAHNCMVDGNYLYIVGNHDMGGLEIYDITNPALPVFVQDYQPFYFHDVDIFNDTMAVAGINGDGIDLIDLTNKSNPTLIKQFNYPLSGAHNCEFFSGNDYLAVGDEIGGSGNHTRLFDLRDLNNITKLSDIIVNPESIVHNCYHVDSLLFIGHYTEGIRVWNVKDPANPFEVGYYDTYPLPTVLPQFKGCWSVYPYFASGKIIVSDMQTGLYVLGLNSFPQSCCSGETGDANADGLGEPSVGDIAAIVNNLFGNGALFTCLAEADADQSGGANPTPEDISVGDISKIIDHLFVSGDPMPGCL